MPKTKEGNLCRFGHVQNRNNKKKRLRCATCEKNQIIKYRERNKEKLSLKRKLSYEKNKEQENLQSKEYKKNNKDKITKRRRYREANLRHPLYVTWLGMNGRCHNPKHKDYHRWGGRGIEVYVPWRRLFGSDKREFTKNENELRFSKYVEYVETILGEKPSLAHSIDRIDNLKGYEPGNLKWSDPKEQANNTRAKLNYRLSISNDSPVYLDYNKLGTLQEFAELHSLPLIIAKYRYAQHANEDWIIHSDVDNRYYEYEGHLYNMMELKLISNVKYSTLRARIQDYGWSVKRAVET